MQRTEHPRAVCLITVSCCCPPGFFSTHPNSRQNEPGLSVQEDLARHGPLICERAGIPGDWCLDCRFVRVAKSFPDHQPGNGLGIVTPAAG